MRLPAQNLLFGISRRGTANSPKCFSTPLPFALHHLLINWVRFPCLSCLSTNSERKGERERNVQRCEPLLGGQQLLFSSYSHNTMQCVMSIVHCAKCNGNNNFCFPSHNQAQLPAGCDPILVFIYF